MFCYFLNPFSMTKKHKRVANTRDRKALRLVLERMKLVIEPSAAVPLAVVLCSKPFAEFAQNQAEEKGRPLTVGVVFSGGNVELSRLFEFLKDGV